MGRGWPQEQGLDSDTELGTVEELVVVVVVAVPALACQLDVGQLIGDIC